MRTSFLHVRLLGRFVRLVGVWLMAGSRGHIRREEGEPSYREKTRQRAKALVHSMVPCETHVINAVKTKRSHDARGPDLFEGCHNTRGAVVTSRQQTRAK